MAHTVLYRTRISESSHREEPFTGHYHEGFRDTCDTFDEAFNDGFFTFEHRIEEAQLHLEQRTTKPEGKHTVTLEEHHPMEYCPFCGAEIEYEEVERTDEREE